MQVLNTKMIEYLSCSICKASLLMKSYRLAGNKETSSSVHTGQINILHCECGMIYPVIKNIPRMLPESFLDYEPEIRKTDIAFDQIRQDINGKYGDIINESLKRNKRTKQTFSFEWGLLKGNNAVKVWSLTAEAFEQQLWRELDINDDALANAIVADVGCGHGRSGKLLAQKAAMVFSMDVGLSVEEAAIDNKSEHLFFIQADLHQLPFRDEFFNLLYSSGVLHHTPNTNEAFNRVAKKVKGEGLLCVWLYHPFNNGIHKLMLALRKITVHLPVRLQFWLYLLFLVPLHKLIGWLKGNRKGWREIMINQLDMLSPQYRFEHAHEEVEKWFGEAGFTAVQVSSSDNYGFSIKGNKRD